MGEKYRTDKSPFNNKPFVHGGKGHRHAYTCFYDSIFNNIKNNKLKILEIGLLFGDSIKCWNNSSWQIWTSEKNNIAIK